MTEPSHEIFEEIGALMAAGAATSEEEKVLLDHLPSCPNCAQSFSEFQDVSGHLAKAISPMPPPPSVRESLLGAIAREWEIAPSRSAKPVVLSVPSPMRVAWPWSIGWGFAVILGVLFTWNLYSQREAALRSDTEIEFVRLLLAEKEDALKQSAVEMRSLRLSLSEKEEALNLMEARQTLSVSLTGVPALSNTLGKLFWNPTTNTGLFIAFDLPLPPPGFVYQLWAIQKGTPVDAGIFSFVQETGSFRVKPIPNPTETVSLFAITLEPAGGSSQPTGEILLKGAIPSQS